MQIVARFRDLSEAHVARSILESSGLRPTLLDEHLIGMSWLHSQAVGGVRLAVPDEEEAVALEILASMPSQDEEKSVTCPECDGHDVLRHRRSQRFRALTFLSFMLIPFLSYLFIPLAYVASDWVCRACGHQFRDP